MTIKKQALKEMTKMQRQALVMYNELSQLHDNLSRNYGGVPVDINRAMKSISRFTYEIGRAGLTLDEKFV